nr:MAG TPA: protein of unknown function (DUF4447) [Caudoviricetes sp.]
MAARRALHSPRRVARRNLGRLPWPRRAHPRPRGCRRRRPVRRRDERLAGRGLTSKPRSPRRNRRRGGQPVGGELTEPLTPAGLRCRREALGLSRADLGVLLDVNEGVIRSWEIGKSEPRDPISIHMLLGEIEDAALDCVDELIESVDDENEGVRALPTALIAYQDILTYRQSTRWAMRLPLPSYRACVGRAYQLLSDQGIPVQIVTPYD